MAWTAIKAVRVCTTGSLGIAPVRVRAIYTMTSIGKGAVSISDGNVALLVYDTPGTSGTSYQLLPDAGIRFVTDCSVTAPAGTVLTIYYD